MNKDWEIKTLKEITSLLGDGLHGTPKYSENGEYYFINGNNLDNGKIILKEKTKRVSFEEYNKFKKILNDRTVFVSINGTLGNVAFYNNEKVILGKSACYFNLINNVDRNFIKYFIQSSYFIKYAHVEATGSTIKNVSLKSMRDLKIPLPKNRNQQKQIVEILDKAFESIEQAKANIEKNIENTKELFQSRLNEIFSQKGDGWEEKELGEVAQLKGRIGWKGLTAKEYQEKGPLFISVHSLNYGDYIDFSDAFHISNDRYEESPEIMLQENDILICKDGAGIGKLGIVPKLPDKATINSSILLIRSLKYIETKYLYYALLSPFFQKIVQDRLQGSTTPHLYQRDIKTFPIYFPKIDEQKKIVLTLDSLNEQTKQLEKHYNQKLKNLEELKKSILQKAFSGELLK